MIEAEHVYRHFRKVQSLAKNRAYRIPKNFEKHLEKMSQANRDALLTITQFFNTKWSGIDIERYFECGFELRKGFSYKHFLDPRIIKLYIRRDKNIKRSASINKKNLVKSMKFVRSYMAQNNIRTFHMYCMSRMNKKCLPVVHYIGNKIDHFFLTWLIRDKMVILSIEDRAVIPYILDKYRDTIQDMKTIRPFIKKMKEKIEQWEK